MRQTVSLLLVLGVATIAAAADSATEQAKARAEIENLLGRLTAAEQVGDALAVSQCYSTDALLLPSSGEPVKGRDDILKRYQAIFAGKTPRLPLESEELWLLDDLAVSRGTTRAAGPRRNVRGPVRYRYVMTLKRRGDGWEIHSLVWNSTVAGK